MRKVRFIEVIVGGISWGKIFKRYLDNRNDKISNIVDMGGEEEKEIKKDFLGF